MSALEAIHAAAAALTNEMTSVIYGDFCVAVVNNELKIMLTPDERNTDQASELPARYCGIPVTLCFTDSIPGAEPKKIVGVRTSYGENSFTARVQGEEVHLDDVPAFMEFCHAASKALYSQRVNRVVTELVLEDA